MSNWDITAADFISALSRTEVWRAVSGFSGYEVSTWGRVRSSRTILTPGVVSGYFVVSLRSGGATFTRRVHVLVAEAFLGEAPFDNALVAHNDGNKENCRLDNLRWASATENQADRKRHLTHCHGSRVFGAKLDESDIPVIRARIATGERYPSIAEDFGVSISTIHLIAKGKIWRQVTGAAWPIARTQEQAGVI